MLIEFELVQEIHHPIDSLFAFISNPENLRRWNYYLTHVEKLTTGQVGVGSMFRQYRRHDEHVLKVTVFDPPSRIEIELQPPSPHLHYGFVMAATSSGTKVAYFWKLDLTRYRFMKYIPWPVRNGLISIANRIIQRKTRPAVEQNFFKLKELLETGQVVLQDGRTERI